MLVVEHQRIMGEFRDFWEEKLFTKWFSEEYHKEKLEELMVSLTQ